MGVFSRTGRGSGPIFPQCKLNTCYEPNLIFLALTGGKSLQDLVLEVQLPTRFTIAVAAKELWEVFWGLQSGTNLTQVRSRWGWKKRIVDNIDWWRTRVCCQVWGRWGTSFLDSCTLPLMDDLVSRPITFSEINLGKGWINLKEKISITSLPLQLL